MEVVGELLTFVVGGAGDGLAFINSMSVESQSGSEVVH